MASQQNFSQKAGEMAGQAEVKKDEILGQARDGIDRATNTEQSANANTYTAQATNFLQQTGEQVKSMAQGAAEAVKNTLGMNNENPTSTTAAATTTNHPTHPSTKSI